MSSDSKPSGLKWFLIWLAVLAVVRILFAVTPVNKSLIIPLTLFSAVFFVAGPMLAMMDGANWGWTAKRGLWFLLGGVAIQAAFAVLVANMQGGGALIAILEALAQTGLLIWCLGLGALVASVIKEKNLLLPIAIFLAGFDAFLVFNPQAPTAKLVEQNSKIFQSVASVVPKPVQEISPESMRVAPLAFVGPADLFFVALFFVCIYRFSLREKASRIWVAATLVGYLLLVLSPLGLTMLPALVPIGISVLLVNLREFKLEPQERQATWGVLVIALALAGFGLYRRFNQPASLRVNDAQAAQGSDAMPAPTSTDQRP